MYFFNKRNLMNLFNEYCTKILCDSENILFALTEAAFFGLLFSMNILLFGKEKTGKSPVFCSVKEESTLIFVGNRGALGIYYL